MTERLRPTIDTQRAPFALTNQARPPRLDRGVLFMATTEPGQIETTAPRPTVDSAVQQAQRIDTERLSAAERAAHNIASIIRDAGALDTLRDQISQLENADAEATIIRNNGMDPQARIQRALQNYTRIAQREGRPLTDKEKQFIAAGISPISGGSDLIDEATYPDAKLQNVIHEYNEAVRRAGGPGPEHKVNARFLADQIERVRRLLDEGNVDQDQARLLLDTLNTTYERENPPPQQRREGFWQNLRDPDFEQLERNPVEWLNKEFDSLYAAAEGKDIAQLEQFSSLQRSFEEAYRYLKIQNKPEVQQELSELYNTRVRLAIMNSAISSKNLENVAKVAGSLTAHNLLLGAGLDDGKVGTMFYRLQDLMEDRRLDTRDAPGYGGERQHVSPEMIIKVREKLIAEQYQLAANGVGAFADVYEQAKDNPDVKKITEAAITRAVGSANDMLNATQRLAVIAARGRNLFGADAYFSDPGSTFSMFNFEAYSSDKFDMFNVEDQAWQEKVREAMVRDYIEEKKDAYEGMLAGGHGHHAPSEQDKEDAKWAYEAVSHMTPKETEALGRRLMRDLLLVNDFFSSSWRVKGINDQIGRYFKYLEGKGLASSTDAKNFGLFLQLKAAGSPHDKEAVWERIKKFRPEEMIRLLHERLPEGERDKMNEAIFGGDKAGYIHFKEKYGEVMQWLREQGLRHKESGVIVPQAVDYENLTQEQRNEVIKALGGNVGAADVFIATVGRMKQYITDQKVIRTLIHHHRFNDVNNRTILVDDALLDTLEKPPKDSNLIALSRTWSDNVGGDALVRNINDIVAAKAATEEYIQSVRAGDWEGKKKAAEECANNVANYAGRDHQAMVLRYTLGTFLELSAIPMPLDALGIARFPFRQAMTEIERIYGQHGVPMSQEQRRHALDELAFLLKGAATKKMQEIDIKIDKIRRDPGKDPITKAKEIADLEHEKHGEHLKADKYYFVTERRTKVRGKDIAKRRLMSVAFGLLFALFGGVIQVGKESSEGLSLGGGRGGGGHH